MSRYPAVAVNAIIFDLRRRVLLTKRADVGLWCLPGGMVEIGETVEQALRREVHEEIGCEIDVGALVGVYSASNLKISPPARLPIIVIAARCSIVRGVPALSSEVTEVDYFSPHDLPHLVPHQRERISDALSPEGTPTRLE